MSDKAISLHLLPCWGRTLPIQHPYQHILFPTACLSASTRIQFIFTEKKQREMNLQHFLHEHTLSFFPEANEEVYCDGCDKTMFGPFYGCSHCDFYLHSECARLPKQIEHFFHPCPLVLKLYTYTCNACFMRFSGFSYRCVICHFNLHVDCVKQPSISSENDRGLIQHFTHWHPLTLVPLSNKLEERVKVFCTVCEKLCSDSAYGCQECKFFLHNSCMTTIPRKINHFFHSCPLILLTYPSYNCGGCGKSRSGLTYSCGKCRFKLDVKCGLLPTVESRGADMIQHFSHPHPLALRENKEAGIEVGVTCRCRACGEDCLDSSYGCSISCDFFLHSSCAELPKEIHQPLHLLHPLNLTFLPPQLHGRNCFACNQPFDSFLVAYSCYSCDFILHKDCAHFTPSFKYGSTLHALTLCNKRPSPFICNVCGKKANKIFLRCMLCGFNIHLFCQPSAPKTIKHKCHVDSLTLTKSPFEFELNSPEDADNSDDEFYCDVCEEKREKKDPVYYCAGCRFIAEVGCVISELLPTLISEDQNAVSSRVISKDEEYSALDPIIAMLNNEIEELSSESKLLIEEREPLKLEIEPLNIELGQLRAREQEIEAELKEVTKKLDNLEVKRFLSKYQPKHSLKEKIYSTEASTSGGLGAEQS